MLPCAYVISFMHRPQAQDLRRVLEGEVAARMAAVARLREAEKAAAGVDAISHLALSPTPAGVTPMPLKGRPGGEPALDARRAALQADVDGHSQEVSSCFGLCIAKLCTLLVLYVHLCCLTVVVLI